MHPQIFRGKIEASINEQGPRSSFFFFELNNNNSNSEKQTVNDGKTKTKHNQNISYTNRRYENAVYDERKRRKRKLGTFIATIESDVSVIQILYIQGFSICERKSNTKLLPRALNRLSCGGEGNSGSRLTPPDSVLSSFTSIDITHQRR